MPCARAESLLACRAGSHAACACELRVTHDAAAKLRFGNLRPFQNAAIKPAGDFAVGQHCLGSSVPNRNGQWSRERDKVVRFVSAACRIRLMGRRICFPYLPRRCAVRHIPNVRSVGNPSGIGQRGYPGGRLRQIWSEKTQHRRTPLRDHANQLVSEINVAGIPHRPCDITPLRQREGRGQERAADCCPTSRAKNGRGRREVVHVSELARQRMGKLGSIARIPVSCHHKSELWAEASEACAIVSPNNPNGSR